MSNTTIVPSLVPQRSLEAISSHLLPVNLRFHIPQGLSDFGGSQLVITLRVYIFRLRGIFCSNGNSFPTETLQHDESSGRHLLNHNNRRFNSCGCCPGQGRNRISLRD